MRALRPRPCWRTIGILRLASLTGDGHVPRDQGGNKIEASLSSPSASSRASPTCRGTRDCSLGRHSSRCCSLTVGISVTGADQRTGQLGVVAGSTGPSARLLPRLLGAARGTAAPDCAGDVTVHCSCTPAPWAMRQSRSERRVMYTDFVLPPRAVATIRRPAVAGVTDRVREQAYKAVSQVPLGRPERALSCPDHLLRSALVRILSLERLARSGLWAGETS